MMRIRSFRTRIALLSLLCSSLALVGSSLVAWQIGWNIHLQRVDRRARTRIEMALFFRGGPPPRMRPPMMEFHEGPPPGMLRPDEDFPGKPFPRRGPEERPFPRRPPMDIDDFEAPEIFELVIDSQGRTIRRTDNWPESISTEEYEILVQSDRDESISLPTDELTTNGFDREPNGDAFRPKPTFLAQRTIRDNGRLWRVNAGWNENGCMVLGVDLTSFQRDNWLMIKAFVFSIPVALAFIALGAAFLARRALQPIDELIRLAEGMTASGLDARISETARDEEFERLIRVFNQMMVRLERSFKQANRFSADAAHELRTPLTILQGHVEQMLHKTQLGSQGQEKFERLLEEIHRIKSILEKLLLLARMDAGQIQLHLVPIDFSAMVESIVEDMQSLAPDIKVETSIQAGVQVCADAALLETAIQNLGSNAIKYNLKQNGRISVELTEKLGTVCLAISNTGPAVKSDECERIFERFYRTDLSRSRTIDGLGLGLSLARDIIHTHHGRLEFVSSEGGMNRFEIALPSSGEVSQ